MEPVETRIPESSLTEIQEIRAGLILEQHLPGLAFGNGLAIAWLVTLATARNVRAEGLFLAAVCFIPKHGLRNDLELDKTKTKQGEKPKTKHRPFPRNVTLCKDQVGSCVGKYRGTIALWF